MSVGMRAGAASSAALAVRTDPQKLGKEWLAVLATVPLFAGLSRRHLKNVASLAKVRRYEPGTLIVRAGRPGDAFYVILDGEARVDTGRSRSIRLRGGDFFGEMSLLDGAPRSASVEAVGEVLAFQIGRTSFSKLLKDEPQIPLELLKTLARRLRDVQG